MCEPLDSINQAYQDYRQELVDKKILLLSGVQGVYGLSGVFESIVEAFERFITLNGKALKPEVMRFPPILNRQTYLSTDHIETMPDLMGSVHSFIGDQRSHLKMIQKKHDGQDWTSELSPSEVMMVPAA